MRNRFLHGLLSGVILLLLASQSAMADNVYATIRGTVTDPTAAVVQGAQLTATNNSTGVEYTTTSRDTGAYEFLQLPVGTYTVTVTKQGFKSFKSTGISVAVNQIFDLPITLSVGSTNETVEVKANPAQVETTDIQQKTLISAEQIVDLPLNGRNFAQLQQLAPGVMSGSDRFGVGIGGTNFSVNGSQTQQSSFLINGLDVNDIPLNTAQILPSPDAIQEFNLLSSTINPEYGRNSGGIVNALIKNGTNTVHGSAFEFYRDNFLNARNFFSPLGVAPIFHQNQFGGTIGGPIFKDKTFFFLSYQGTYNRTGGTSGVSQSTTVFSPDQRNGIFTDLGPGVSPRALIGEDGISHPAGTPYSALFPTGHIPAVDLDALSLKLMNQFVPLPNAPNNAFNFNPLNTLKSNQGIMRIDHNLTKNDLLWGVYLVQDAPATETLPFTGATLPGFTEVDKARTNDITIAWNHVFNTTTLNEVRLGYARFNFDAVEPQTPATPASFGFSNIVPQNSASASMPLIAVGGLFTLGFSNNGPQPRKDQNYQFTDNLSKIAGKHSLKVGFDVRRFQVDNPFFNNNNGNFQFQGGGSFSTGDPGADFLLGIPDAYTQGAGGVINARAYEYYTYFQDQWKVKSNLTLTLGSGYQVDTPYNNNQFGGEAFNCFIPSQQSKIFPTAPLGLNYPGDPGCTRSGTTTHFGHVAPRFGFAWSPNLGAVSGAKKLSIRGGFGVYFNRTEEEGALQNLGAPPFGVSSSGAVTFNPAGQPGFANPFFDQTTSTTFSTIFPFTSFPTPGQPFNFDALGPQALNMIDAKLTTPYAMNFNLNVEREFAGNTVVSLGYVGSLGRHLYRAYEANQITAAGQAACKIDPTCVALASVQNLAFPNHLIDPSIIQTGPSAGLPFIAAAGTQHTDGTSNYNAFQANVTKGMSHGLQLIASYTWSHAIDNGSGFEDSGFGFRGVNPFDPALNVGDSSNDARQRFVFGYVYQIPSLHHLTHFAPERVFGGWKLAGITTFQTGFPINISTSNSSSLFCSQNFTFYACPDNPNQVKQVTYLDPKAVTINGRTGFLFDPHDFAQVPKCKFDALGNLLNGSVCGQFGNVARNSVRAPGINNFDMSLIKDTKITERTQLEFGLEAFNLFNHTNFVFAGENATSHGDINSGNFGRLTAAAPGRILQLRAKVTF